MKKDSFILKAIRGIILFTLLLITIIALFGELDDTGYWGLKFLALKGIGLLAGYIGYKLWNYWYSKNLLFDSDKNT
jgi:hypothetical protein